jgi:hypothetical protein
MSRQQIVRSIAPLARDKGWASSGSAPADLKFAALQ